MILKIVYKNIDGSDYNKRYRGVARDTPYYIKDLPEDNKVNQAFFDFLSRSDNAGITNDLAMCKELVKIYANLGPQHRFEIIEITDRNNESSLPNFLGFDLVFANTHSLLALTDGLNFDRLKGKLKEDNLLATFWPLFNVTEDLFRPMLNKNGLFENYEKAEYCLDALMALQKIIPKVWENEKFIFVVKGVWSE